MCVRANNAKGCEPCFQRGIPWWGAKLKKIERMAHKCCLKSRKAKARNGGARARTATHTNNRTCLEISLVQKDIGSLEDRICVETDAAFALLFALHLEAKTEG